MSLTGNEAKFPFEARLDLGALTNNAPRLLDKSNGPNGANGWSIYFATSESTWVLNFNGEFTSVGSEAT